MPRALTSRLIVLPNSGIKRRFFWRFGYFRTLPVGLNLVARVRLEYPPPTIEPFLVMAHTFFIIFLCYHITHMDATNAIFYIAILIMSIVIHEVSHGFMAEYFGDNTARSAGRLTLNPIRHLDLFGSIILPAFLVITRAGFLFGWAKPVPYNPNNLSDRKWGTIWVAAAGVLSNFLIAIIFGIIIRATSGMSLSPGFYFITSAIVIVNLALGIFNLIPIPPLDGSKILFSFLPESAFSYMLALERYGLILLLVFIIFFAEYLFPVLAFLFHFITGLPL
ncbi:TPA: site-2 protease family protein [Candidatus Nomurabacteria bacterium]|nr:site-2 protease family protein [Candidatus Nomurabacteria bacterium]HCW87825.1 site-2 protease family protein [Candidatus Nomurabacteria bacterium]